MVGWNNARDAGSRVTRSRQPIWRRGRIIIRIGIRIKGTLRLTIIRLIVLFVIFSSLSLRPYSEFVYLFISNLRKRCILR